ncbi:acyl-CoA thioesterase [Shewanella intestini]|uniref:Acyl-CoA thioesterase n=1 Tax=Shewanella intestini TaxID=2017544 RepID=A0ABS5I5F7_9GAMM|nr:MULTISPECIES: thioesterase family protein [Shewanella]MBR9728605.1 acyl-CoA thioesterase [Shewanella intestini]MRG37339.1 acyl-CoA thioesterase [Shewanella sp. XMDDZSB0408]
MEKFIATYPIHTHVPVAWGDMDALQHVNNANYFRYFETARLDFFTQIDFLAELHKTGIGPVVSETNARYKRPVTYPDNLIVGVSISDIQPDRFKMHYHVYSQTQQAISTIGWANIVMFNFKTAAKANMTPELLTALTQHQQTS